jgi:2-hydroxychromene-2-carboxylate isomerase
MPRTIEYYFSMGSPWAYLGHATFVEMAKRYDAAINYKPVPLGHVFSQTGGLPVAKRHPARQRYRLIELQRWRARRGRPLNLQPKHWPLASPLADRFIIAIVASGKDPDGFMRRAFAGVWAEERDLADPLVVAELAEQEGLDSTSLLEMAGSDMTEAIYALNDENAVAGGVFGSPGYVLDGELFWGQDRLDFLEEALASGRPPVRPEV